MICRFRRNRSSLLFDKDSFRVLPDDVLVHILSFLSPKDCVATSILAKRWRFLWARVRHLCFNSEDYRPLTRARLSSIINRALFMHRGYTIETFGLYYRENDVISNSELKMLVAALIACNILELTLLLDCDVKLPRYLFTCQTLVKLYLTCCFGDIPATVYLPALKRLTLFTVYNYESVESLLHLLSGCPMLEKLTIRTCSMMKKVSLGTGDADGDEDEDEGMDDPRYFLIGPLTSLAEANIQIFYTMELIGRGNTPYFRYVVKLVGKVCDVTSLKLKTRLMMEVPDSAFSALSIKFHNLTKLHLAADWRLLTKFLESADNLEDLTISTVGIGCPPQNWMEPDKVAACLVSRVGIVRYDGFVDIEEQEFKMVSYILRNAKVLKRMIIHMNVLDSNKKLEVVQKIQSFERGSEACEIAFEFVSLD